MPARSSRPVPAAPAATNVAVVRGHLVTEPRTYELAAGGRLVTLDLRVRVDAGEPETVPVAWADAPDPLPGWEPGQELLVVGRIRRRFFRAGGSTATRTEVVAAAVVPTSRRAAVAKAVAGALASIGGAGDP